MPHDHALVPDLRKLRLLELHVRGLDGDLVVDAYFEGGGEKVHLAFVGVEALRVTGFTPGASGYRMLSDRRGPVKLVPPNRRGIALSARAVMSVD